MKTMFAVIKTGGKQYRVAADDVLKVEKIPGEPGQIVQFGEVLVVGGDVVTLGTPTVAGATVAAAVLDQMRGPKVIAFKKRRRKNSRRKRGHRQELTLVQITEILTDGATPTITEAPRRNRAAKPVALAAGERDASNLSLISGVGPTIEAKLREAGIKSWNDIAAWTDADVEKYDHDLGLRGRAKREEWVEQAKELLAGKPPRAKVDRDEEKSGKDL
jgi:large subunit ribosomal protein L21